MILFSRFTALLQSMHSVFHPHIDLALENLALRQQLAAYKKNNPRPKLSRLDRIVWVLLKLCLDRWQSALLFVTPESVARWHRKGFNLYWKYISRRGKGKHKIDKEIRNLIHKLADENPIWRAPRIHGELLKLDFRVSERTVSRYLPKREPSGDKINPVRTGGR